MRLRYITIAAAFIVISSLLSCSTKDTVAEELKREEIAEAAMQGRNAARTFLNRQWNDTIELMRNLLEVKAQKSRYELARHPHQAEAFDSAFIHTIRAVDPVMAASITAPGKKTK